MTAGAWLMLVVTWAVVIFFTARFFWLVLTMPSSRDDDPSPPSRG